MYKGEKVSLRAVWLVGGTTAADDLALGGSRSERACGSEASPPNRPRGVGREHRSHVQAGSTIVYVIAGEEQRGLCDVWV